MSNNPAERQAAEAALQQVGCYAEPCAEPQHTEWAGGR
jgi:hypothetical protein